MLNPSYMTIIINTFSNCNHFIEIQFFVFIAENCIINGICFNQLYSFYTIYIFGINYFATELREIIPKVIKTDSRYFFPFYGKKKNAIIDVFIITPNGLQYDQRRYNSRINQLSFLGKLCTFSILKYLIINEVAFQTKKPTTKDSYNALKKTK